MCYVLKYLLESSEPLIEEKDLEEMQNIGAEDWQDVVKDLKGANCFSMYFILRDLPFAEGFSSLAILLFARI